MMELDTTYPFVGNGELLHLLSCLMPLTSPPPTALVTAPDSPGAAGQGALRVPLCAGLCTELCVGLCAGA